LKRVALIVLGVLLFLVISGLLARFFSAENVERSDELALVEAETRGDAASVVANIHGCAASAQCVALAKANAKRLRRAVVQCVKVRRSGNFLTGINVTVQALSAPIANEGVCGKQTQIEREEEEATEVER
jgi:hypothetical protein